VIYKKIELLLIILHEFRELEATVIFMITNSEGNYLVIENSNVWDGNELINIIKNFLDIIDVINSPSFDKPT